MSRECVNVGTPAAAASSASEILGWINAGCVADQHANTDGAGGEVGRDLVDDPRHLRRGRSLLPIGADQPGEDRGRAPVERPVGDHVHARRRP